MSTFFALLRFLAPPFGGGPSMPAPQAPATNPMDDMRARQERQNAADAAQAEALAGGRRSTIVAGIKDEDQQADPFGMAKPKARAARQTLGM